jgi:hypothetical protein
MEYTAETRLPLQLWRYHLPFVVTHVTFYWYDPSLIFTLPFGRSCEKGLSSSPFLVINAKGGENIKPKAKGPHHQFQNFHKCLFQLVFKANFQLVSYFKKQVSMKNFNLYNIIWYTFQKGENHFKNPLES